MKVFLDTSVLVAALVHRHPNHQQAFPILDAVVARELEAYLSTHSLAEAYAVLTRLPLRPSIHPSEARLLLERNVLEQSHLVELDGEDYRTVLASAADNGWRGGVVYDALLLQAATKVNIDRIYTFNVSDFQRLAPQLSEKICSP